MAVIREDEHSLYARVGGYIARPIFPIGYRHIRDDGTQYSKGEKVSAGHQGGAECSVGEETWFIHGDYLSTNRKPKECWKPDHKNWGEA